MKKSILTVVVISLMSAAGFALKDESASPPAEDVSKSKTITTFFKENTDLRVADEAGDAYLKTLNELSVKVIQKATQMAKDDKRKTVLDRDVTQASDEVFRRAPITVAELMEKVIQLSIIDLSELASRVRAYANSLIEKKK